MSAPRFAPRRRPAAAPVFIDPDERFRRAAAEELDRQRGPKQCQTCFAHLADEDRAAGQCPKHQPVDPRVERQILRDVVQRLAAAEARLARLDEQNAAILSMKVTSR